MLWLDQYERHARLAPGFLALLPAAVLAIVVGLRDNPIASAIAGVVVAAGGPIVLAGVVRQRGLALQADLYTRWNGPPTTSLVRLRVLTNNMQLRAYRRQQLSRVSTVPLLTEDEESSDPKQADAVIETAVSTVRERTRDRERFPLVAAENRTYGFERNILAVRSVGITIGVGSAVVTAALLVMHAAGVLHGGTLPLVVGVIVEVLLVAVWLFYPSEARVNAAAIRYAERLLDAASAV